jgi:hypothetical protein
MRQEDDVQTGIIPGRSTSVVSEHLNPTAAQRQFIAQRVGCDEPAAAPEAPTGPGDGRGKHEGVDPEDRRWKGQECLIDEVVAENRTETAKTRAIAKQRKQNCQKTA